MLSLVARMYFIYQVVLYEVCATLSRGHQITGSGVFISCTQEEGVRFNPCFYI